MIFELINTLVGDFSFLNAVKIHNNSIDANTT